MFCAFEVIARPQTHESEPSSGAIHSTGDPVVDHRLRSSPCPPSARTTSPDLNRLTIDASESPKRAELVAVVEQVLLDLVDLLVVRFIGSSIPSASAVSAIAGQR